MILVVWLSVLFRFLNYIIMKIGSTQRYYKTMTTELTQTHNLSYFNLLVCSCNESIQSIFSSN